MSYLFTCMCFMYQSHCGTGLRDDVADYEGAGAVCRQLITFCASCSKVYPAQACRVNGNVLGAVTRVYCVSTFPIC
jgi:hypothetical protein